MKKAIAILVCALILSIAADDGVEGSDEEDTSRRIVQNAQNEIVVLYEIEDEVYQPVHTVIAGFSSGGVTDEDVKNAIDSEISAFSTSEGDESAEIDDIFVQNDENFEEVVEVKEEVVPEEEIVPETVLETEPEPEPQPETEPQVTYLTFTDNEKVELQKLAFAEAGGETVECMALVMRVVLNRVQSAEFPNTIDGVIFQSGEFSPIYDGAYNAAQINDQTQEALNWIINGWDESQGALYFEAVKNGNSWHSRHLQLLFENSGVRFYK